MQSIRNHWQSIRNHWQSSLATVIHVQLSRTITLEIRNHERCLPTCPAAREHCRYSKLFNSVCPLERQAISSIANHLNHIFSTPLRRVEYTTIAIESNRIDFHYQAVSSLSAPEYEANLAEGSQGSARLGMLHQAKRVRRRQCIWRTLAVRAKERLVRLALGSLDSLRPFFVALETDGSTRTPSPRRSE